VTVASVMAPAMLTVFEQSPIDSARLIFADDRVHVLPVVDADGKPIGFVTPRDVLDEAPAIRDVMTPFALDVPAETPLILAARLMVFGGFSHLPVVDREGCVVGILSATDVRASV
jgi:IMP dehydrogenase